MGKTGRPFRSVYLRLPEQSAAPIAVASTTNAAVIYTDGASVLVSIDGAAYTSLATLAGGGTFTSPITIDTSTAPAFSIDTDAVSGTLARIRHDVATTPTGALIALSIDLTTNWTAGNVAHTGVTIAIPATTAAAAAGVAALAINSDATLARVVDIDVANTSGTLAILRYGAAVTLTATALIGLDINLATNVTAATNDPPITGIAIRIPATDAAAAAGEAALVISSDATAARAIDVDVANTTGTILIVTYGAATTLTAGLAGLTLDLNTNVTGAGTADVSGLNIYLPPGSNNASYGARFAWSAAAGTAAGNGIINVDVFAATTLTGQLVGIECDLNTNVTPGALAVTGLRILIPATTRASTAGEGALVISSDATAARAIDVDVANTSGTVAYIRYGAGTTLAGQIIGIDCDLSTNVTPGAVACIGQRILIPATTRAETAGEGALVISSTATRARAMDIAGAWVSGSPNQFRYGTATTTTGALFYWQIYPGVVNTVTLGAAFTGMYLNCDNGMTPGAFAVTGLNILVGATTRANTALEGALVIESNATAARAIDVDIANTSGTPFIMRYGAATELNAVVMATLDMSTNVTTNTSANVGLDVIMLAADRMTSAPLRINGMRIFTNAGIPLDANGSNGDLYIDTAGDKDAFRPTIYQRQSAAWVSIA